MSPKRDETGTTRVPIEENWFCPSCGAPAPAVMVTVPVAALPCALPMAKQRLVICKSCKWEFEVVLWQPLS